MTCRGGPARIRDVPTQGESRMGATVRLGLVGKSFVGSRLPSFRGAIVRGCPHPSPLDSRLRENDELRGRSDEFGGVGMTTWVAGRWAFAAYPPRMPTRDTPTVVLASGGTPVGNTGPAG